jgi:hypothetical protein
MATDLTNAWSNNLKSRNRTTCIGLENATYIGGDSSKLDTLAQGLTNYAEKMQTCQTNMFGIIDAMENGVWTGTTFDEFRGYGVQYREAVLTYAASLALYASIFADSSADVQDLAEKVLGLVTL